MIDCWNQNNTFGKYRQNLRSSMTHRADLSRDHHDALRSSLSRALGWRGLPRHLLISTRVISVLETPARFGNLPREYLGSRHGVDFWKSTRCKCVFVRNWIISKLKKTINEVKCCSLVDEHSGFNWPKHIFTDCFFLMLFTFRSSKYMNLHRVWC